MQLDLTVQHLTSHDDGNMLQGQAKILGADFHVRFIKVNEFNECHPLAHESTMEMLDDVHLVTGARNLETVSIPDHQGNFVMLLYPFAKTD